MASVEAAVVSVDVVVFGAGFTGARVCEAAERHGFSSVGVVRRAEHAEALTERGIRGVAMDALDAARRLVDSSTHAVITFPPDGATDERLAELLRPARAISYLSTTGVYEDIEGWVSDATPLPETPSPKYARVLAAERVYREVGSAVLRSPGIYGPDRGIHVRLERGDFRLSGDGSRYGSRIHVEDLAELLLASASTPGETFVVGDLEPCPQREMVAWLCQRLGLPFPPSAPLEEVHETLRRNRRIDGQRALARLNVTLKFPNYRTAFAARS